MSSLTKIREKLWNILKSHKRLGFLSGLFVCALIAVFLLYASPARADMGEEILGAIGGVFIWLAGLFMSLTVKVLRFVIEIASYNDYINSSAVNLGWILVRDITNMFFVIILMVIAFGTVLGIEKYEWKSLLAKFVLAAILVNFSRVICGVIIDAAQVFMMTFISGVAATAGGNLVTLFQMNSILEFAKEASAAGLAETGNMVVAAIVACVFSFTAMVVIGAYLVVLLGRVMALWILIILSPLAFILGVIPKFQSYASQWWQEFTNNVVTGPVLVFFLWLSFAVAGGASIHAEIEAASPYKMNDVNTEISGVATMDSGTTEGTLVNAVLQNDNLANFIIACALLLAGVKVTQKLGGLGAGALGVAASAATKFATMATGLAAARWGVQQVGKGAKAVAMAPVNLVGKGIKKRAESAGLALKAKAYEKAEWWNREVVEKKLNKMGKKPGAGLAGFVARRMQIGSTDAKLETRKKILEKQQKLYSTSIVEPEAVKSKEAFLEARLEEGARIKAGVVAGRMEKARKKVAEIYSPAFRKNEETGELEPIKLTELASNLQAKAARIEFEHKRDDEMRLATARDREYESRNPGKKSSMFTDNMIARHKKEDAEFYHTLNADKLLFEVEQTKNMRDNIGEYEKVLVKGKDSDDYKNFKETHKDDLFNDSVINLEKMSADERMKTSEQLLGQVNDMIFASQARSTSLGEKAMALGGNMTGEKIKAGDAIAHQAEYLSCKLGEAVKMDKASVDAAFVKLKQKLGKSFNATLTADINQMEQMADNGAVELAGLFTTDEKGEWTLIDERKRMVLKGEPGAEEEAEEFINPKHGNFRNSKRLQAAQHSRGKTRGVTGSVDKIINNDGSIGLSMESDKARENLARLYSGISLARAQTVSLEDITDFNKMLGGLTSATMPIGEKDKIIRNFQDLIKRLQRTVTDPRGIQALFKRLDDEIKMKLAGKIKVKFVGKDSGKKLKTGDEVDLFADVVGSDASAETEET